MAQQNSNSVHQYRQQASPARPTRRFRLGVLSYLPARPLIYGLDGSQDVDLVRAPPARLKRLLAGGEVDAALLPTIDLPCFGQRLTVMPAGCLAGTGPTLLVKIFSQVKPENMSVLWSDSDSHATVALVQVVWANVYHRRLSVIPFDPSIGKAPPDADAAMLIGDKVVTDPPLGFDRHIDPVAMWYEMTGLPFVGAVWTTVCHKHLDELYAVLLEARQRGQQNLVEIATEYGPGYGWPADLAIRCLTQELQFEFTSAHREGMEEFLDLAAEGGLIDSPGPLNYYCP